MIEAGERAVFPSVSRRHLLYQPKKQEKALKPSRSQDFSMVWVEKLELSAS